MSGKGQFVQCLCEHVPFAALCDNGADIDILTVSTFTSLPLKVKLDLMEETRTIQGLGGEFKTIGRVEIPLRIGSEEIAHEFYLAKDKDVPYNIMGLPLMDVLDAGIYPSRRYLEVGTTRERVPLVSKGQHHRLTQRVARALQMAKDHVEEEGWKDSFGPELTEEQVTELMGVLKEFPEVWRDTDIGKCTAIEATVDASDKNAKAEKARRMPEPMLQEVDRQVADLLAAGAIEPSVSPWSHEVVMAPKPKGRWRLCCDFRPINSHTTADRFPLPDIITLLSCMQGAKYVTSFDLKTGFHQLNLRSTDRHRTAFRTRKGLWQWKVLPYGLRNAPAFMQRCMTKVLGDLLDTEDNIFVYIDDIVFWSDTFSEHKRLMRKVLQRLKRYNMFVNVEKSHLGFKKIRILGQILENGTLRPNPEKVQAIYDVSTPTNRKMVRRFLGMSSYFRQYVQGFAQRTKHLRRLTREDTVFQWGEKEEYEFCDIKSALCANCLLYVPDLRRPFEVHCDASGDGLGAVLYQRGDEGKLHPVEYASRSLSDAEKKWSTRDLEALSIVWSITRWRQYLLFRDFEVFSDHDSLKYLWNTECSRLQRWAMFLQQFSFTLTHKAGKTHHVPDLLSRDVQWGPTDHQIEALWPEIPSVFMVSPDMSIQAAASSLDFPTLDDIRLATKTCKLERKMRAVKKNGLFFTKSGRVYLPESLRSRVLHFYHFDLSAAHRGVRRARRMIERTFYWPKMGTDIDRYVDKCLSCRRRRLQPVQATTGSLTSPIPLELLCVDIVGPLDVTKDPQGKQEDATYILTVMDAHSRYVDAVATHDISGSALYELLNSRWFCRFGYPTALLTDKGKQFVGGDLKRALSQVGVRKLYSNIYHPQGNALIESFHALLKKSLAINRATTDYDLQVILDHTCMAHRSTPHEALRDTPFRILTGLEFTLPQHQDLTRGRNDMPTDRRHEMLKALREEAWNATMARVMRRQGREVKKAPVRFRHGDVVFVRLWPRQARDQGTALGGQKFVPTFGEPHRVVRDDGSPTITVSKIWGKKGVTFKVNREDLMRLPKGLDELQLEEARVELISDLKRLRETPKERAEKLLERRLKRLHAPEHASHRRELEDVLKEIRTPADQGFTRSLRDILLPAGGQPTETRRQILERAEQQPPARQKRARVRYCSVGDGDAPSLVRGVEMTLGSDDESASALEATREGSHLCLGRRHAGRP